MVEHRKTKNKGTFREHPPKFRHIKYETNNSNHAHFFRRICFRKNGELDLFENAGEHLSFLNGLLHNSDCIMLGRVTYEMFKEYWPGIETNEKSSDDERYFSKWYNSVTKLVFSNTISEAQDNKTIVLNNDSIFHINELKTQSGKDILLFGSATIGQVLKQENLIDEYWIFINPVVFGEGIPMFNSKTNLTRLKLIETKTISNGELALHYVIVK